MDKFEEIIKDASEEELGQLKLDLFREHVRLEMGKNEEEEKSRRFAEEKSQFQAEVRRIYRKMESDKKRLREDQIFFDKKLAILQGGFQQLDEDRRKIEQDRQALRLEQERARRRSGEVKAQCISVRSFFQGVNNTLTLKKRYKDLIKIFHPDNICGDTDTVKVINQEYTALRDKFNRYNT